MQIDFYLIDAMEIDNYVPIYKSLCERGINAQLVAIKGKKNTAAIGWFDYENAIEILKKRNIIYTTTPNYSSKIAITTQHANILDHYKYEKYRLSYGISLSENCFSHKKEAYTGFDGVFVHGQYSQKIASQYISSEKIFIIGYPKYDSFFKGEKKKEEILNKLQLNSNYPIIVYLPTHTKKSTINSFSPYIIALQKKYQLLIKPHHCTYRMESTQMQQLQNSKVKILHGNYPLDELYSIADLVIADTLSGSFTEAILTNCKTIGLLIPELEKNIDPYVYKVSTICTDPFKIEKLVAETLLCDNYFNARTELREKLFSHRDGNAAIHATDIIMRLLEKKHFFIFFVNAEIQCQIRKWKRIIAKILNKGKKVIMKIIGKCKKIINKIKIKYDYYFVNSGNNIEKSFFWFKNNIIEKKGISISSKNKISYPEVTGYTIPTFYEWGEKELALNLTKWLMKIQNADGSFSAPDGVPYTFDTGQVIRGFVTVLDDFPEIEKPLRKACDWILGQIQENGKLSTPSTKMWGNIIDDRIHLYVLPPLFESGKKLKEPKYINAANKILQYYKFRKDLIEFNTLSHFHAYIIEALCDLGEIDLAKKGMEQIITLQKKNGSIQAYKNVKWVCIPGLAQYAVILYKLKEKKYADKIMSYLEKKQNKSGGFYGSYTIEANYFYKEEISWAVKFFLDAYSWKIKTSFNQETNVFSNTISEKDGRIIELISALKNINGKKIIEIGCGKGRFLQIVKEKFPQYLFYGLDISEEMLKDCPDEIKTICGSILNIKYPDNYFDCVYCIETLEHSIRIENAIKEMIRILKPNGKIIIIDKNIDKLGQLKLSQWEKWFNPKKIMKILNQYKIDGSYKFITDENHSFSDNLFIIWQGIKK